MKTLIALLFAFACLLGFFAVSGCGGIVVYGPDGKVVAAEFTCLKTVGFKSFSTTQPGGSVRIQAGTASVDDQAVKAITDGVVAGVVRGIKP